MILDLAELWLDVDVVVLHVLAHASCNITHISIHRLLVACVVFSMLSHQVSFQICLATAVLNNCSTDFTYGQTSKCSSFL